MPEDTEIELLVARVEHEPTGVVNWDATAGWEDDLVEEMMYEIAWHLEDEYEDEYEVTYNNTTTETWGADLDLAELVDY